MRQLYGVRRDLVDVHDSGAMRQIFGLLLRHDDLIRIRSYRIGNVRDAYVNGVVDESNCDMMN
jgi:hypothetical protein